MNPNAIPFSAFVSWWAGVAFLVLCAVVWTADHWPVIGRAWDRLGDLIVRGR